MVSKKAERITKKLAMRFNKHSPPLCTEHKPDGLPIDTDVERLGDNHPSKMFEEIVQKETQRNAGLTTAEVYSQLYSVFAREYSSNADQRSCVVCYNERKNTDNGIPIRIEMPDNSDIGQIGR